MNDRPEDVSLAAAALADLQRARDEAAEAERRADLEYVGARLVEAIAGALAEHNHSRQVDEILWPEDEPPKARGNGPLRPDDRERFIKRQSNGEAQKPSQPPLDIINVASFAGKPVPPRNWFIPDVIIADRVTMFSGNGGDGKSLLAKQLSVATVTGTDWIGFLPKQGGVLYASAEDGPDEIHRRLADIIAGRDDLSFEAMDGFSIINLSATDAIFMKPEGRTGTLAATALFFQIEAKVEELRPVLLVTDALANVYAGDENVRTQVAQFIALLDRLAITKQVTIILIAHPSLSGILSGTGSSGNTHWNNGARGRLYLEPATDKDGEPDPCLRKLTIMKSNYGPKGISVAMRWDRGRFLLMGGEGSFERMAAEAKDESLFLKLLKIAAEQGRTVSPFGGRNYAPSVFADMPDANKTKAPKFKAAMERLLRDKKIVVVEIGVPSKRRATIVEV